VRETFSSPDRGKAAAASGKRRPRSIDDLRALMETESRLSWLFVDIHRLLSRNFEARVRGLGLTRVQLRVLFTLERTQAAISQTELADLLEMEKAPLGKIIDRLEEGGWVVRRNHPTDRRAKLVSVTAKIERFGEQIAAAAQATFAELLQGVRQNEVKELIARLEQLKRNLGGADV
jgi:DNA-binding MarR family transcriptional regulator